MINIKIKGVKYNIKGGIRMLFSSMIGSRRFFPGSLLFVLLWGGISLFLWEVTRSFSMIQPAHGPFVALLLFLSAASAVYFLLSLGFYFQDREVMEVPGRWIVFALLCLVILAYLAVSLLVIQAGLKEARWDESWGVIPARYFGYEGRSQGEGAWHWGPLLAVLGVLLVSLVCNMLYLPVRLRLAQEKGYDMSSVWNMAASVAELLLILLGLARPMLYGLLGAMLLLLFCFRISRLGVLHAFLFTLFQPFMLLDSSLGRMKWVATAMPATDLTPVEFRSRVSGLRQTVQQETKEEFQREIDEQNSLKNRKEEK